MWKCGSILDMGGSADATLILRSLRGRRKNWALHTALSLVLRSCPRPESRGDWSWFVGRWVLGFSGVGGGMGWDEMCCGTYCAAFVGL